MKIEEHLDWKEPEIWVENDDWDITINQDEVEIECGWDNGYAGRGTERMTISREKLKELLEKFDK